MVTPPPPHGDGMGLDRWPPSEPQQGNRELRSEPRWEHQQVLSNCLCQHRSYWEHPKWEPRSHWVPLPVSYYRAEWTNDPSTAVPQSRWMQTWTSSTEWRRGVIIRRMSSAHLEGGIPRGSFPECDINAFVLSTKRKCRKK